MTSLQGLVRPLLLTVSGSVAVTSYAQQPPDVVQSDKVGNTAMGSDALLSNGDGSYNTAAGFQALAGNRRGASNTAVGDFALSANFDGLYNTAVGFNALANQFSNWNTAIGYQALESDTSGGLNSAVGAEALASNTTGGYNSALGMRALQENLTGTNNTAIGEEALYGNTSGTNNTAAGMLALASNTAGNLNTASGYQALSGNRTGSNNTGFGADALGANQSGSNNIAVGFQAGSLITGYRNIDIGNVGAAGETGTIRIGNSSQHSATYIAGVSGSRVTGLAVYVTTSGQLGVVASSERYKTNVASMGSSSEKVRELRPVTFRLKSDPKAGRQYGLIAEEVAKVYPELVIRNEAGQAEGVRYEELTPMLLNEVQRQQQELAELKQQVAELQRKAHH
jgi:hypothetical protein